MTILIFRLEGVLQSWGERSRWDHRDSADMPTKSGIIGLLGCAFGYPREDKRLAELSHSVTLAVRADRPGMMMTDYHTVQGKDEKIVNATGKPRSSFASNTIVSRRQYIQDACFTVFLTGDDTLLRKCADALRTPTWAPCLGRRSCPPSIPLHPTLSTEYQTLDEAVQHFRWTIPVRKAAVQMRAEIEDTQGDYERVDMTICSSRYEFARRRIRYCIVKEGSSCT